MAKKLSLNKGILLLCAALMVWCCPFIIKTVSPQMIDWFYNNINLPATHAATIVTIIFMVTTYLAAIVLIATLAYFLHEKPFFECVQHQSYRYFAFWGMLPLAIVPMGWEILSPYFLLYPNVSSMLGKAGIFFDFVLFLAIAFAILSVVCYAYGLLIKSNIYLNAFCGVVYPLYICYAAFIVSVNFEYGKWFLIYIIACYFIEAALFVVHKKSNKKVLIPKYEIVILSIDEDEDEQEISGDDTEYDFSIFMPKDNKGE